ncbi:hypothetical protein AQUCO_00900575v1 [Aquilegia coerulea]|uniref:HRDC domain-containing protein n=1 Tax=Aquilegia coerulea TaxID=218851 RepID=A0A2G5EEE4_AQUCA|nr:hypothetical protein AQUCO_00900575v1 [Aquilegia coerulea]
MKKEEDEFGQGVGFKNYSNELENLSEERKKMDVDCNVAKEYEQGLSPLSAKTMTTKMNNSKDKKMTGLRPSVPFHISTIPRPQDEFNIFVNNTNQPFEHVWLQRSEDGSRIIHPLEKLSESDFIDQNVGYIEPVRPPPIENTPFKLVEDVKELKQLAAKLHSVNEFAVDLEHNQYRSFQGLTCLMQISTRLEDYIVDTLKLRVYVGPYLREVFKDPSKRKVMHGADRDIVWLQRDFGIYICNMFDTQQASRVLDLERNSLEFLMLYFCGITVNKTYQNADWRLRPLPEDMLKYAREDTHYLLYIYDLMRRRLLSSSTISKGGNDLLLEVYRRSYDVCMQLYEKELLTNTSYLYIYGLQEADFNSQQLSVVAGLCEWRDAVARAEDESTGYILPNKTLLEIARQMPLTIGKLRRLVKAKHPYVEVNVDSIIDIIKNSIQNAAAFEPAVQQLKNGRQETVTEQNIVASTVSSQEERIAVGEVVNRLYGQTTKCVKEGYPKLEREIFNCGTSLQGSSFHLSHKPGEIKKEQNAYMMNTYNDFASVKPATEEVSGTPRHDFGLGISASKSKIDSGPKVTKQNIEVASRQENIDYDESVNKGNAQTKSSATELVKEELVTEHIIEVAPTVSSQTERIDGVDVNRVKGQTTFEQEFDECSITSQGSSFHPSSEVEDFNKEQDRLMSDRPKESFTILGQMKDTCTGKGNSDSKNAFYGATEEVFSNPSHRLRWENSTSKFKTEPKGKLEQIKSCGINPFYLSTGNNAQLEPITITNNQDIPSCQNSIPMLTETTKIRELASLGSYISENGPLNNVIMAVSDGLKRRDSGTGSILDALVETISLSNWSSRFQKCLQLQHDKEITKRIERAQEVDCGSHVRGFLQSMKQERLKQDQTEEMRTEGDEGFKSLLNLREGCNSLIISRFRKDEVRKDFQQAKQCQASLCAGNQTSG